MANELSPGCFFHTDSRSTPASPNNSVLQDELTVLGDDGGGRNRVLIGEDATKDPSDSCLSWALNNIIKPGDSVTVLGILHRINTPMGYKSQANLSDFIGTNKIVLEAETSQKLVCFEEKLRPLADVCDSRGVYLDITITAGTPMKSVLVKEASKMKVTHVILDWNLRRDRRYYKEHLECNVVAFFEKNQVECIRDGNGLYIHDNPRLPLQRCKAAAIAMASTPDSVATSIPGDGNSIPCSDHSNYTGETRATSQHLMSRREDALISFNSIFSVDTNNDRRIEELRDFSPVSESGRSTSSSASPSRENSFIDLFMVNSPDGIMPVWSCGNVSENGRSPASDRDRSELQIISTSTKLLSSPMGDASYEILSTTDSSYSALSISCSSDQIPSESLHQEDIISVHPRKQFTQSVSCSSDQIPSGSLHQEDIISVHPKKQFTQLLELIRAHEYKINLDSNEKVAESWATDSHQSVPLEGEEAQLSVNLETFASQEIVSDSVVEDVNEEHATHNIHSVPHKLNNHVEGTDCFLGNTLAQAPPLCSVCKLISPKLGKCPKVYDWEELKAATNDFSADNLIAEGGFGVVYKGTLQEGQIVAIKKLKSLSLQGDVQFTAEVEALSCAQHMNLVRLLGYCVENNERALVYEYVCNYSLDLHLSGHNTGVLEWSSRYRIALGAARGLRYLHEECRVGCIVHRDMRPNNILLTHDFTAMVGDFGLAKLNSNVDAAIETQVIGSLGFVAPEYVECGQVTSKTDVYSFGVVLLELISGRKAVDMQRPKGEISLIEWARPKLHHHHRIHELVDQKIEGSLDMHELNRMVKAASLCIKKDPSNRPGMSQVLRILEGGSHDLSINTVQEILPISSSIKPAYKSHSQENEEVHQPVDRLQLLHSTSKRVLTAPRSRRNWVRTA